MTDKLPIFRYHPDPITTGSVEASSDKCDSCGQRRGYRYVGPVYATGDSVAVFCPWCIADGTAAMKYSAELTDVGWGMPDGVPESVRDVIAHRTPGFESWQQDHWLFPGDDGCAFLGRVGRAELEEFPEAMEMLLHENEGYGWADEQSSSYVEGLDAEGDTTAYLFRCLSCRTYRAFSDSA